MKSYISTEISIKDATEVRTGHFTRPTGEVLVYAALGASMEHSSNVMASPEVMEDLCQAILTEIYKARADVRPVPAAPGYTACDRADAGEEVLLTCGDTPEEAALLMAKEKALKTVERLAYQQQASFSIYPRIVCLCGSTRFYEAFQEANYSETMAGRIVLSGGFYTHSRETHHRQDLGCTPEQKIALDELHKRKIDLANEILVLNVGGYIGDSTRSEIEYARRSGKPIRWLEAGKSEGV